MAARKKKNTVDYFPEWNPTRRIKWLIEECLDRREAFLALRRSASGFINKPEVRRYIFERGEHKCLFCNGEKDLTIDHINSVISAFIGETDIKKLNTKDNLQVLCRSCNSMKAP